MKPRDKWAELVNVLLHLFLFLMMILTSLFAGCSAFSKNKGKYSQPGSGGSLESDGVAYKFTAPVDPSSPSTITRKTNRRFYFMDAPKPWAMREQTAPGTGSRSAAVAAPTDAAASRAPSAVPHPAPSVMEETVEETATTGAAHVDTSKDLMARLESFKPVQYVGCAFLAVAAALFIPWLKIAVGGGKTTQMACAAIGMILIFGPNVIVGHETLLLIGGVAALLFVYLTSRLSHKEGMIDANKNGIPDDKEKT